MEIKKLSACEDLLPVIACLQQLEMRAAAHRNLPQAIEKYKNRQTPNENGLPLVLVAFVDTLPVASVSLIETELPSHAHLTPWVASLFTVTSYRNRGIGVRLMEALEKEARALGFSHLHLYTPTAASYYARMGWYEIGSVHPDGKEVSVLMQKKL